jgi:hypothetical protein
MKREIRMVLELEAVHRTANGRCDSTRACSPRIGRLEPWPQNPASLAPCLPVFIFC